MNIYINLFLLGSATTLLFPPFFFIPIGFIIIPYFFYKITVFSNQKKFKESFVEGFVYGLGLNFFLFFWLKNPFLIEQETKNFFYLSYLYVFYASIYYGLLVVIVRYFKNESIQIIVFPIIFVLLEIIRSKLFIGFPWNLFGYIFSHSSYLFGISKYIGTYALSYVVVVIFLVPFQIFNIINKKGYRFNIYYLSIFLSILTILYIYSFINQAGKNLNQVHSLDVVVYQSNTPQNEKWDLDKASDRFEHLVNFIEANSKNTNPTVIIYSETEIPYIVSENDKILNFIQSKLDNNTAVIIGGIRKNLYKKYFNSIFIINSKNINYFDKKILVPFGEYIPLKNFIPFINKFTYGSSDFSTGKEYRNLSLFENINFIPTICFENIFFEDIVSSYNYNNAIIVNITNDSWFGKYQGPYQHFYQSIARSSELNKYLIRVSSNGISAIIDPNGKVLTSTSLNEKITIKYNLKIENYEGTKYFNMKYTIFYLYLFIILLISSIIEIFLRNER